MSPAKAIGLALVVFLGILLAVGLDRQLGASAGTTPSGPQPIPTLGPGGCVPDRDAIQTTLYLYHNATGDWPTADGKPGDMKWDRLIPLYLPYIPSTDARCNWQVNSDPEGEVCLWELC